MFDGKTIAKLYEKLTHSPKNPEVLAAYRQFAHEIELQFESLPETLSVEFVDTDAYKNSSEMFADIECNNRLRVWSEGEPHTLMPKHINNKFRAVHDYFGHYVGRNNFSGEGEIKAYIAHSKMFGKLANRALFTETIGQNSWFNYAECNIGKPNSEKKFATQKAGLII